MLEPHERPPIASSSLSVILHAHALSTETQDALQAWRQFLDTLQRPYEIMLLQETRPEVETASLEGSVRVIPYERDAGVRDALNEAIRTAHHPLVVFCPCDKQYQPADLQRMFAVIDKVDLVAGYRAGGPAPPWRVVLDRIVGILSRVLIGVPMQPRRCWLGSEGWGRRWVARWIFGVRVLDPECPFRLARREIFMHLPIQSGGPFVHVEMLAKANHLTCLLAEEPVAWTPPDQPDCDAISFGHDAYLVFRKPDFGPYLPPQNAAVDPSPPTPAIE